jgi:hypothetical protein
VEGLAPSALEPRGASAPVMLPSYHDNNAARPPV